MKIKEIENLTEAELIELLKILGLGKNKQQKMKGYEMAKKFIFGGKFINSSIYDKQISWICNYLRI